MYVCIKKNCNITNLHGLRIYLFRFPVLRAIIYSLGTINRNPQVKFMKPYHALSFCNFYSYKNRLSMRFSFLFCYIIYFGKFEL